MTRIAIPAFAADQGKSGIGQYIRNLLLQLPDAAGSDTQFIVFITDSDRQALELDESQLTIVTIAEFWGRTLPNLLWHLFLLPWLVWHWQCDQVIFLAGNRRLGFCAGRRATAVVHDLSQLHVPGKYDAIRTFYVLRLLPMLMRRMDRIVSVSESTRRDLIEFARVDSARTTVVHNGADLAAYRGVDRNAARDRVRQELGLAERYLLYTARLEHPGKNHVRLLDAFAELRSCGEMQCKLVLAGGRWNGADVIEARVTELGLENEVLMPGFVDADLLPSLVAAADGVVFPSLYEGFGIPLLEAMAAGTPICASDVSSIPEVLGGAGLLFDPADSKDLARSMHALLTTPGLADRLREAGIVRATRFSWPKAARGLWQACAEAVEPGHDQRSLHRRQEPAGTNQ